MKKLWVILVDLVATAGSLLAANTYILKQLGEEENKLFIIAGWIIVAIIALAGRFAYPKLNSGRLSILRAGWHHLFVFGIGIVCLTVLYVYALFFAGSEIMSIWSNFKGWLFNLLFAILAEAIVFWSGMLRIFFTSEQLAIKWRVIAAVCGLIPVVNLIVLGKMMSITDKEIRYENNRIALQNARKPERICATKYPILMVHGIFFRDFDYMNYWGRIPKALEENGARIFYGEHVSSASVDNCGKDLAMRIRHVCEIAGSEKVNVIAHSKGGLDTRAAIARYGADKYVASLTTINTPHRGCEFAEYLLNKIPKKQQDAIAAMYNKTFKRLGDENPNFMEGVSDLTYSACLKFNEETPDSPNVYYQSVGSRQNRAASGRFPMNMSYALVKHFDGENDGLVGKKSFPWGADFKYLAIPGNRGISHGDMIDLNRENFDGFDVREFYIELVNNLKNKGF
ncbi:MAG: triacylglycerol lipase [Lachnospiraceae bacterium]|nr:triacylglycerol lipase [Lachnospiraceae bacterium]